MTRMTTRVGAGLQGCRCGVVWCGVVRCIAPCCVVPSMLPPRLLPHPRLRFFAPVYSPPRPSWAIQSPPLHKHPFSRRAASCPRRPSPAPHVKHLPICASLSISFRNNSSLLISGDEYWSEDEEEEVASPIDSIDPFIYFAGESLPNWLRQCSAVRPTTGCGSAAVAVAVAFCAGLCVSTDLFFRV